MDIARFHYAIDLFIDDLASTSASEGLAAVISCLSNVASTQGQPQYFEQYKAQLETLRQNLLQSNFNEPSLELADFITELSLQKYVGNGLFESVISCISTHNLSVHHALGELQKLQNKFQRILASAQHVNDGLAELQAPYESPDEGDAEIEIKIPVEPESQSLDYLAREAKEWNRDLNCISEIFDPTRPEALIRTLSTGSWEIYLASTPLVLFGISKCIKGINTILADLINSKRLLTELLATKAPKKIVSEYEKHIEQSVGTNLTKLASDLVDEYYKGNDAGRKSELKNALTQSLKRLSKKISDGSKVSLRLTKASEPAAADPDNPTDAEARKISEAIEHNKIRQQLLDTIEQTPRIDEASRMDIALPAPEADE